MKLTVDEKKLDSLYREYLTKIHNDPGISHNLKSLAPEEWMVSTTLISCVFASIMEENWPEMVEFSSIEFKNIKTGGEKEL